MTESVTTWPFLVPIIFGGLALVFGFLAWRDKDQRPGLPSPARKARIRIAVIFALVSAALFLIQLRS